VKIKKDGEDFVEVTSEDCVIVFRSNGSMEAFIPSYDDEDEVSEAAAAVLLVGVLFSEGEGPERFRNKLMEYAVNFEPEGEEVAH
jgi:hypothetical protein